MNSFIYTIYVYSRVYFSLKRPVIEDPFSGSIRDTLSQGFNPSRLPSVPPDFSWRLDLAEFEYKLIGPNNRIIYGLGVEAITWCNQRALQYGVDARIERYYFH